MNASTVKYTETLYQCTHSYSMACLHTHSPTYIRYNVTSLSKKVNSSTRDFSKSSTQDVSLCLSPECGSCVRVRNGMCFFLTLYMRVFFVFLVVACFFLRGGRSRHQLAVVLTKQVGWMSPGCDSDSTTPHCQLPTAEAGRWRRSPVGWLVEMSDVSLHGHSFRIRDCVNGDDAALDYSRQ